MREFTGFKKGINLGGWLAQCDHTKENYDSFIGENDIEVIHSWGLDHVRLPIDYELLEEQDGTSKEEGFSYIDNCIDWCQKRGIKVILALHKTAGYSFYERDNEYGLFEKEALKKRFIHLWEQIAMRYGALSNCIAFELLNEVSDKSGTANWNSIVQRTIAKIREYTKDTKIIVGGISYNSAQFVKYLDTPKENNIIYNFHCYEPILFTHQSCYWMHGIPLDYRLNYPTDLGMIEMETRRMMEKEWSEVFNVANLTELSGDFFDKIIFEASAMSQLRNVPLYCSEYGVIDKAPLDGTLRWFQDVHAIFEKNHISRAVWNYKGKDFGLADSHYDEIREELLRYL